MAQMAWKLDHAAGEHRSDHELVQASRHDAAAFDVLYRRYVAQVFWYLRSRTASREDAADVTQQVFLRCCESLAHYEDRGLPLALRFAAGLRLTEIAALRGKSEAATRKQLQRLIQALKEQYEDD